VQKAQDINWDVLALARFVLACIVVSVHTYVPSAVASSIGQLGGKAAVVGFLLISGFSIAGSIDSRPQEFLLRRILRIYPMYFGALLLTLVAQGLLYPEAELQGTRVTADGWLTYIGNFLLTQLYLCKAVSFNGPVWSLSIEFSYYVMAPLFLLLPRLVLLCIILISGCVFVLPQQPDSGIAYDLLTRFNGLRYLWPWLIGFCLYFNHSLRLAIAAMAFALVVFSHSDRDYARWIELITIAGTLLLLHFSGLFTPGPRLRRAFAFLGDISYPLYLVHFPLAFLLFAGLGVRSALAFFVVSLLMSWIMILVFDGPVKQRIFKPLFTFIYHMPAWKRVLPPALRPQPAPSPPR
jgi:peptidoglycan/LPS O-acetylase OafA/YrhL